MKKKMNIKDFSSEVKQLSVLDQTELLPLPPPYDNIDKPIRELSAEQKARMDTSLDGISALGLTPPATPEEEQAFIEKFLAGTEKIIYRRG